MMKSANELMFQALLTDPEKRKKVLELLTSEGLVPPSENTSSSSRNNTPSRRFNRINDLSRSPLMQLLSPKRNDVKKKPSLESPSALFRRRALQKLDSESSVDDSTDEKLCSPPPPNGTPVPFDQLLKGVTAYCEVRSNDGDRSAGIKAMMKAMGATIRENFTKDLTHVVFKDGLFSTFQKAKLLKVHLVSVLWLEAVRRHKFRVPEKKYPALGVEACDANVTAICQALQNDYDDVLEDEYRRRSEIKHQTKVLSKNKFVTQRRMKYYAPESETTEFDKMSGIMQLTGSTSGISRTTTPDSSVRASPTSISSEKYMDDIVPCSQDGPASLSNSHNGNRMLMILTDDESNENINPGRSSIARHVKDSLELQKSLKVRSPESLASRKLSNSSSVSKETNENRNSLDEELSMRLHITTTDESNVNSTGNKSRSSSMNAQAEIGSKDRDTNLIVNPIPKKRNTRRMTLGISDINNSKSLTNLNESRKTRASTMNTSTINKSFDSSEILTRDKVGKGIEVEATPDNRKTVNRRTTRLETNKKSENDKNLKTIISDLTKSKQLIQSEDVHAEQENAISPNKNNNEHKDTSEYDITNLENNSDKQVVKPRRRKLYQDCYSDLNQFNVPEQSTKIDELQNEAVKLKPKGKYRVELPQNFQVPKTLSNKARRATVKKTAAPNNTGAVKKTIQSVQKLVFSSTSSDENPPNNDEKPRRKSPRKGAEGPKITPMEVKVIIKKLSPIKRNLDLSVTSKLASDSEDAFMETSPVKRTRKSVTTESSGDNEMNSDEQYKPNKSCTIPCTPARRSVRLSSRTDNVNDQSESPKTPSSALRRSTRRTIHNSEPSTTKTQSKTPNLRKQVLTSKARKKSGSSSDEQKQKSERRSTLEFIPRPSRISLERIKLTQKSKHVVKLCSIVCTRLHKEDGQIFQQIVKKLGGFIVEDEVTERTTHLVAGTTSRTINMLRAIARGCWIVRQEWLFKSLEADKWLEEEEFELTDFSPAVQKCRLQKRSFGSLYSLDIFKECGPIHVCRSTNPRCSDLEELVSLCGGNVVKTPRLARIIVGDYFRYDSISCVNEKWVLDCVSHNKKKSVKSYLLEPRSSESPY